MERLKETLKKVLASSNTQHTTRMRAALALCVVEQETEEKLHPSRINMIRRIINGEGAE